MLSQGPLPRLVHGLIEYLAAALFIVAPWLFGFDDVGVATAVSIVVGVVVLFVAATTDGPTSLVNQIPLGAHVVLDFLLAGFLIAAPFIFGFSDEDAPLVFFIAIGVAHLLVTIATRFSPPGDRASRRARRREGEAAMDPPETVPGVGSPTAASGAAAAGGAISSGEQGDSALAPPEGEEQQPRG